jgi:hypothetical protein
VKLADYDRILEAALVNLHTGQLLNANGYEGEAQEKRLRDDFDMLIALERSARKIAAEKLKD